ncbi:MAG TPA: aminoglycoside phosphotransferase family protein [Pyrinomonadaceae bacterium]|jgi:hygromycin-B 7''-O-kinase|nr:aminoglycoside phosphotransferase family protein [Pyrinomonadaceae bacterium]
MSLKLPRIADAEAYRRHFDSDVWRQAVSVICARHRVHHESLQRSPFGENIIFFVDERFVVKIFAPFRENYERETAALAFASDLKLGIETPAVVHAGEIEGWPYLLMTRLAGVPMRERWAEIDERDRLEIVSRIGAAMRELHAHPAPLQTALNRDWPGFVRRQARESVARQRACGANPEWLESLPAYIAARLELLPPDDRPVMLHGDVHPGNVLLEERGGRWQVTGLFDFGDSLCGFHEYEFVAPGVLMVQGRRELQRAMLLAYGYTEAQLDSDLRARLMLLTVLYECSDLRKYALRLRPEAVRLTLDQLEAAIWTFATR